MPNQWKPTPPLDIVEPWIRKYHGRGLLLPQICRELEKHYDTERYGLKRTKLQQLCIQWGLKGTRKQGHTFETIANPITDLKVRYPAAGVVLTQQLLRHEFSGMRVPKELIRKYNNVYDIDGVRARKVNRLRRRVFHAAGVNHVWAMDQHDKWKKYGLRLHLGVEPFTGKLLWLVIWWTNSNPKFVARQYFRAAKIFGGIPLVTQSDMGTENYGVAYSQTSIRHRLDPSLQGTLQHNWMSGHRNIKPEACWWRLRNSWTPGFEDMLEHGVAEQWYNPENTVDSLVFRWVAVPFLQRELDSYVHLHNTTARRANPRKTLPHGVPDTMFEYPETVGALDFKITVPDELLSEAEAEYAPPSDPVFELVPPAFQAHISSAYGAIGSPTITFNSFWDVYLQLRDAVDRTPTSLQAAADNMIPTERYHDPEPLPFPILPQARFGDNGIPALVADLFPGPAGTTHAEFETNFTDDEEEQEICSLFTDDDSFEDDVPVASFTNNRANELY